MEQNYFALFGLPNDFTVNVSALGELHQRLLKEVHPDKHAGESAQHERIAVQLSAHINNAYDTLKSPLSRGEHLLLQLGVETNHQNTTISDVDFLMQQMQWRELLSEIKQQANIDKFSSLHNTVSDYHEQLLKSLTQSFLERELVTAKEQIAQLYFVEKMLVELDQAEYELDF